MQTLHSPHAMCRFVFDGDRVKPTDTPGTVRKRWGSQLLNIASAVRTGGQAWHPCSILLSLPAFSMAHADLLLHALLTCATTPSWSCLLCGLQHEMEDGDAIDVFIEQLGGCL